MQDANFLTNKKFTSNERRLKYKHARLLRDMMLEAIENWNAIVDAESDPGVNMQRRELIKQKILDEANHKLVWKVLAKDDRYDTPYFKKELEVLRRHHPDLTIENKMDCFISWPVFSLADIERVFEDTIDIPAFVWENAEK